MGNYSYKNYKIVDADLLDADLTRVADAIREKGGTSDTLNFPDGFVSAVEAIEAGGGSPFELTDDGEGNVTIKNAALVNNDGALVITRAVNASELNGNVIVGG